MNDEPVEVKEFSVSYRIGRDRVVYYYPISDGHIKWIEKKQKEDIEWRKKNEQKRINSKFGR